MTNESRRARETPHESTPSRIVREQLDVDVAVLGAGTAGLAAYRAAVEKSARVVMIEAGPYGNTCAPNMPSRSASAWVTSSSTSAR